MARVRRDVWRLPYGDETLSWYGRAIGEMQGRPITDPTSWRFQAAIHDYIRAEDPLAVPGEALPSPAIRRRFWRQCQHGSWFFLPWHRMYLHFFEEMIAAEVVRLGGPADWGLPYWNYSAGVETRLLPEAFRNPNQPANNLFVTEREPDANAGQQFADEGDVALQRTLTEAFFSDPSLGNFGGLPTSFSHSGDTPGWLEIVPHGAMHVAVGGATGWMGGFNTAALDPMFWLHHANIDRLWQVWLNRDAGHQNPTSLQWLSMVRFSFYNASQQIVEMGSSEVVDTAALGYTYEDVSDPLPPAPGPGGRMAVLPGTEETMPQRVPPELVGATEAGIKVRNATAHLRVATPQPIRAAAVRRLVPAAADAKPRVLLQLENLTARGRANSYDVYVNVPEGEEPTEHPELVAGRLDLFGVREASRATDQHPGSGLTYTLDVTEIYHTLSTQPGWDPESIRVSLVPVRKWEGATVTVGRVSLYFA